MDVSPAELLRRFRQLLMKATKRPWNIDENSNSIYAEDGQMRVADIRGWGYLTGGGAKNLPDAEAAAIQDANAELVIVSVNYLHAFVKCAEACRKIAQSEAMTNDRELAREALKAFNEKEGA